MDVQYQRSTVNQGCMSLSTYYLEYGHHVARLHRRRCCRPAYVPTSNTTAHDNHEKINSWVSFPYMVMGLRLAALQAARAPLKIVFKDQRERFATLINVPAYICIRVYSKNIVLTVWIECNKACVMSRDRGLIELSTIFDCWNDFSK